MAKSYNDEVIIKNNKIYTSYFARASKIIPDRRLVSIALTSPDGWRGSYFRELNPSPSLLSGYKNGRVSTEEYKETYHFETLSKLKPEKVYEVLKGKVLCCWEKSDSFCHRHLVTEWLKENLGEEAIGGEI